MLCFNYIFRILFLVIIVCTIPMVAKGKVAPQQGHVFENYKGLLGQKPEKNKVYAAMATFHFNPKSLEKRNWNNKLIGLEYEGYFVGVFENSFYNTSWIFSIARDVYVRELSDSVNFTAGYHLGLMSGYEEGQSVCLIADSIQPLAGIYGQFVFNDRVGVELLLTTSISASLFLAF